MRVTKTQAAATVNTGLAQTMKLVIAVVFVCTIALLNITQRPALQPATVNVTEQAEALAPATEPQQATETAQDAPADATPQPKPFDAKDPTTWPKCAADEIVRADNGQCSKAAAAPAAAQPMATAFAGGSGSCEAEIAKYNWNIAVATAVARAESGLNPGALNNNPATGDYSVGCFQINIYGANARTRPSEAALKNAATNVEWAYKIYSGNGGSFIGQWGVCRAKVSCY